MLVDCFVCSFLVLCSASSVLHLLRRFRLAVRIHPATFGLLPHISQKHSLCWICLFCDTIVDILQLCSHAIHPYPRPSPGLHTFGPAPFVSWYRQAFPCLSIATTQVCQHLSAHRSVCSKFSALFLFSAPSLANNPDLTHAPCVSFGSVPLHRSAALRHLPVAH